MCNHPVCNHLVCNHPVQVLDVPPGLERARVDVPSSVYKTIKGKSNAALNELLSMHESGRPCLVGTTSVDSSAVFSEKLDSLGVEHEVTEPPRGVTTFSPGVPTARRNHLLARRTHREA